MKKTSLTDQIAINPSGWDELDVMDIIIYDATLVQNTRKFKKGDIIESIAFMTSSSTIELYQDGEVAETIPMVITLDLQKD